MGKPLDWGWIGLQVKSRRSELHLTRDQVAARTDSSISISTLASIEKGEAKERSAIKLARLAEALQWPSNAFDHLQAGNLPPKAVSETTSTQTLEAKVDEILGWIREQKAAPSPPVPRGSGRSSR